MKTSSFFKCAAAAGLLPLFAGCVEHRVVYRDRPVSPGPVVTEDYPAPPPPQTEVVTVAPGPAGLWYWAPGCWEWRGRWVWTGGHWMARPHVGAVWVGPHWGWHGRHRIWVGGGWR